jgi:hypothetical protein
MYVSGNFWPIVAGFVGILLALILTVLAVIIIRPPLSRFLEKILGHYLCHSFAGFGRRESGHWLLHRSRIVDHVGRFI